VRPETLARLLTPGADGYAGGWFATPTSLGPGLVSSGSNSMWTASALVVPSQRIAVVLVANQAELALEDHLQRFATRIRAAK
jgi:hypothetical protein